MRPFAPLTLLLMTACSDASDKSGASTSNDGSQSDQDEQDAGDDGSGDDGSGDDGSGGDGSGGDGSGDDGSGDDGSGDGGSSDGGSGDGGSGDGGSGDEGGSDSGPVDAYAERGCELLDTEPEALVLGVSQSEANTAVILPDDDTAFLLQMPESGDGWFTVEVPDWMTIVRLFTDEGVELEVLGGEGFSEVLQNGACPEAGISDQRWAFHEWGAYTIRVAEGAPSEVWFTLVKEE